MRTDLLGEYDENKLPENFVMPLKLNDNDNAITTDDNRILMIYGFSHELHPRMEERRRGEFVARLVNREIAVDKGIVLHNVGEQWQDGRLVVSYEPVEKTVVPTVNGDSSSAILLKKPEAKKKLFDRKAYMKEYFRKIKEKKMA